MKMQPKPGGYPMTSEAIENMRAEFEKWAKLSGWTGRPLDRNEDDEYESSKQQMMWESWQAAASRVLEEAAQLCDEKAQYYTGVGKGRIAAELAEAIRSLSGVAQEEK